jgi:hypothetical protein
MTKFLRNLASLVIIATMALSPAFGIHKKQLTKLQEQQHKAMHEIVMVDRDADGKVIGGGLCTAYAVGPHTLLTADHCNDTKATGVYIDAPLELIRPGKVMSYKIISRTFDHQDHMLLVVSGVYFQNTIVLTDHVRAPHQGEHTYQWGNPAGIRDQFREGLVTGSMPNIKSDDEPIDASGIVYLIAEPVIGGDSGSSVFSAEDGQLIGIVTYSMDNGQLAGVYAIQFTQAQLDAAGVK